MGDLVEGKPDQQEQEPQIYWRGCRGFISIAVNEGTRDEELGRLCGSMTRS